MAKIASQLGATEYFMVYLFGLTIIAGVSGNSIVKRGVIAACLGLLCVTIGSDSMTGQAMSDLPLELIDYLCL